MDSIEFEGRQGHKLIHEELLKKFTAYLQDYRESPATNLSSQFFQFLRMWLAAHIKGIDRKYGEVAHSKAS